MGFPHFESLFRLYYPRMISYARHFIKNEKEVEDLVQDVFSQLWETKDRLEKEKNISAYIFVLLKNKCLNRIKHKLVEEKYISHFKFSEAEELYHISMNDSGEFVSMKELLNQQLEKVIKDMPEKCAEVFRLRWVEGKKNKEIAEELKISSTMVDKHLAKGLKIARKGMSHELYLFMILYSS